jgi:hypothetical protein
VDRARLTETIDHLLKMRVEKWATRPPRYSAGGDIELKYKNMDQAITAKLFNIGRGGAFVQASENFPALQSQVSFTVRFELEPNFSLSGVGVIRWVRTAKDQSEIPLGYGIEFLFVDEPGRSHLKLMLNKLGRHQFIPNK